MAKEQYNNRNIDETLFRFLDGTSTEEEQVWIKNWLRESGERQKQMEEMRVFYHWFNKGSGTGEFNKEESWSRIRAGYYQAGYLSELAKRKKPAGGQGIRILIAAAAAVVIAFLAGFFVHFVHGSGTMATSKPAYNEVYVPLGARSQITLSDGSKIWLNAGSRIRYPAYFQGSSREVTLQGEAYFKVARMPDKIFIVKTSDVNIKVYGTQFNVKSYPEENTIQTTLVEGSLSVEPVRKLEGRSPVYLKPNQSVTYFKKPKPESAEEVSKTPGTKRNAPQSDQAKIIVVPSIDPLPVTSWKDDKWVIVHENLDKLAVMLERRYNVKITFEDESLKNYKFSGTLKEETFEQVLKIMQISAPILFTVRDNQVTFREDKTFRKKYDTMIKNPN